MPPVVSLLPNFYMHICNISKPKHINNLSDIKLKKTVTLDNMKHKHTRLCGHQSSNQACTTLFMEIQSIEEELERIEHDIRLLYKNDITFDNDDEIANRMYDV